MEKKRDAKSVFVSLGVVFFIIGLLAQYVFNRIMRLDELGIAAMILVWAIASGLIVYGLNMGKTRYTKANDTFVENYKERLFEQDNRSKLKASVTTSLWSIVVVLYLAISFLTQMWSVTWIIFLIGAFVQQLALFYLSGSRARRGFFYSMLWSITLVLYFIVSFAFDAWAFSWIIFLIALAVQEIVKLSMIWRKTT
jgi:hypothetical protein